MARKVPAELLHNNTETDHAPKSHIDTPGRHVVDGTVPDRMGMMTKDQSLQMSGGTTTPQWTP